MRFLTKIINFVKKAFRKVADMFKDKNPVDVVNDTTKTVAAVATTGLALYTGINAIRVHLIPTVKKNSSSKQKSAHDFVIENREAGSIDEKLTNLKKNTSKIGKKHTISINQEDREILNSIARTRNSFFQSLSPEEQLNILDMEDFDFKAYADEYKRKSKRPLFRWGKCLSKFGVSPTNKPFREKVNYGIFNFILQPLDDFVHWLKNDPVPKKVPQIHLVDHPEVPNVECETALDLVSVARNLDSYLIRNKTVSSEINVSSPAVLEEQQILAEEMFKHKTLRKLNKAVNRRMAHSQFNSPNIFDMMDDEDKKKKKKKKKDGKGSDFSFISDEPKKKKKHKGMSKEDEKMESEADQKARALYKYHLEKAMRGEIDRKGFKFGF
jgi:hypothetical protein